MVDVAMHETSRMSGRTIVAIAHRLCTIKNADMIYMLDRGRVVESGRHQELLNLRGRYFELAKQQDYKLKKDG